MTETNHSSQAEHTPHTHTPQIDTSSVSACYKEPFHIPVAVNQGMTLKQSVSFDGPSGSAALSAFEATHTLIHRHTSCVYVLQAYKWPEIWGELKKRFVRRSWHCAFSLCASLRGGSFPGEQAWGQLSGIQLVLELQFGEMPLKTTSYIFAYYSRLLKKFLPLRLMMKQHPCICYSSLILRLSAFI